MTNRKVFCVGFQKTGTKSLHTAFKALGFRSEHGIVINSPRGVFIDPPLTMEKVLPVALARVPHADVFSDNPWPLLYKELDRRFPNSKFILSVRDPGTWIKSMLGHFADKPNDLLQWIYGVPYPEGNAARCTEVFAAHNQAVRNHFRDRPDALLEIDLEVDAGWEPLCRFLDCPLHRTPFPHVNTAADRERRRKSVLRNMKNWLANETATLLRRRSGTR